MLFVTQLLRAQPKGRVLRNQIQIEWMCYICFVLLYFVWEDQRQQVDVIISKNQALEI